LFTWTRRLKLSDPAHEGRGLHPERDGCIAWIDGSATFAGIHPDVAALFRAPIVRPFRSVASRAASTT
jgi:hypothetical protein